MKTSAEIAFPPPERFPCGQAADPRALVDDDMRQVDAFIHQQPDSGIRLINSVSRYMTVGGGKKLRPLIALLAFYGAGGTNKDGRRVIFAAAIELLHIATLLHDDVVDQSGLRRGRRSANVVWSNEACLLIGDFLYSRAFQLFSRLNCPSITRDIARTTNAIAEGEVAQFVNKIQPQLDEPSYMGVIEKKTAVLFQAAARNGAVLARGTVRTTRAMSDYGYNFGLAFQLYDDVLDYKIGRDKKMAGDDLHNGKLTLPVIHALRHADDKGAELIRSTFAQRDRSGLRRVVEIMRLTGSLEYTINKARGYIELASRALGKAPATPARDALTDLLRIATTHE